MDAPQLTLVHLSPTADSRLRWADGTLKGIKTLKWTSERRGPLQEKEWIVVSPLHHAVWAGGKLTADNYYTGSEQVRGEGGIHAIWPPQLKLGEDEACAALDEFVGYSRRHPSEFTALVSGWGRSIMGDVGWRAEHCRIRTIFSPPTKNLRIFRQWCRENGIGWSAL